ncbi:MAG: TSUP family transporter [Nocardioides sp.]
MILEVADWALVALAVIVAAGALVQGTVGLGLGLLAAPVAALLVPDLVPALLLWLGVVMAASTLVVERRGVHWGGLAWALPPRVAGTALGVWLLSHLDHGDIGVAVAVMVLVGIPADHSARWSSRSPRDAAPRGLRVQVTGTTTSISGPPLAVLLPAPTTPQWSSPPSRCTSSSAAR